VTRRGSRHHLRIDASRIRPFVHLGSKAYRAGTNDRDYLR
jgi:hypothetical protein